MRMRNITAPCSSEQTNTALPRHAQKRSTNSQGKSFKLNVAGSDARYSFHHPGTDGDLYVFEAPIDLLSYITLHPENWAAAQLCGLLRYQL